MKKQIFSDQYEEDREIKHLIEVLEDKYKNLAGYIFYKFPTIKEFDKSAIQPDIFLVSKKHGVFIVVADYMNNRRGNEWQAFLDKMDYVDNGVYTSLLKNKELKKNGRDLKFSVKTIGFCPNLIENNEESDVFFTEKPIIEMLEKIEETGLDEKLIGTIVSSLEASAAIIKPKERILPENSERTKAKILKEIEERVAKFDDEQRASAIALLDGPQRIRGLAGSGKTIILCLKAAHLHMMFPEKTILYTFYTKSLYDYIVNLINRFYMKMTDGQLPNYDKIRVRHAWGGASVQGVYYEACRANGIIPMTFDDVRGSKKAFERICERFIKDTKNNPIKEYDYVLMDEAQDFYKSFYQLCRSIVKDDHLIWCYDEVQNIFDVEIQNTKETFSNEFDSEGIDLIEESKRHHNVRNDIVLHKSYRNVREILLFSVAIGFGIYNDKLVQSLENNSHWVDLGFNVEEGDCSKEERVVISRDNNASPLVVEPSMVDDCIRCYEASNMDDEVRWIANEIEKAIKEECLRPDDIAVICVDSRNSVLYLAKLENELFQKEIGTFNVLDKFYVKGFYRDGKVTLSSVFKAKGNEAAMVFVCGCDTFENFKNERKMRNMFFTACTRAKVWLRITGTGKNSLNQIENEYNKLKENDYKFVFYNKPTHMLDRDWNERTSKLIDEEQAALEQLRELSKQAGVTVNEYLSMLQTRRSEDVDDE